MACRAVTTSASYHFGTAAQIAAPDARRTRLPGAHFEKFFKCNTLLAMLELPLHEPSHVAAATSSCPDSTVSSPSINEQTCWRLVVTSLRVAQRARENCLVSLIWRPPAVSSPARSTLASAIASRWFVFTRSPDFFGICDGAATTQSWASTPPRSRPCAQRSPAVAGSFSDPDPTLIVPCNATSL